MPTHVSSPFTNGPSDGINGAPMSNPAPVPVPVPAPARSSTPPSPVPSEKKVQFDLKPRGPSREPSPDKVERERNSDESDTKRDDKRHHHHHHHRRRKDDERSDSTRESGRRRKRHHRDHSPANSEASDATIDLPPRFDDQGRRKTDDPLADKVESFLQSLLK